MDFKDILKQLRLVNNLSQEELGNKVGMKKSNISKYERGILEPGIDTIKQFARIFNVTTDYLLGQSSNNAPLLSLIPVLGQIHAGSFPLSDGNYEERLEIPADIKADFAIRVKGPGMIEAGIHEGDYAICRNADEAKPGDIVIAVKDTDSGFAEAELKYYFTDSEKGAVLRSTHPGNEDISVNGDYRIAGIMAAQVKEVPPAYRVYQNYVSTSNEALKGWNEVIEKAIASDIKPEYVKQFIETQVSLALDIAKKRSP